MDGVASKWSGQFQSKLGFYVEKTMKMSKETVGACQIQVWTAKTFNLNYSHLLWWPATKLFRLFNILHFNLLNLISISDNFEWKKNFFFRVIFHFYPILLEKYSNKICLKFQYKKPAFKKVKQKQEYVSKSVQGFKLHYKKKYMYCTCFIYFLQK